jgi:hypothetical protein
MKNDEATAVIEALESGREFSFESYRADAREVLTYDGAACCFVLTTHHAYDADSVDRRVFTRPELAVWLMETFSFKSFGLPRARSAAGS